MYFDFKHTFCPSSLPSRQRPLCDQEAIMWQDEQQQKLLYGVMTTLKTTPSIAQENPFAKKQPSQISARRI